MYSAMSSTHMDGGGVPVPMSSTSHLFEPMRAENRGRPWIGPSTSLSCSVVPSDSRMMKFLAHESLIGLLYVSLPLRRDCGTLG